MDISMCSGHSCPWKGACLRHTGKQGQWQSWFKGVPLKNRDGVVDCAFFLSNGGPKHCVCNERTYEGVDGKGRLVCGSCGNVIQTDK